MSEKTVKHIERAEKIVGGTTALADLLGVSQACVSQWKRRQTLPAEWCKKIERATNGQVTRLQLLPEVFA